MSGIRGLRQSPRVLVSSYHDGAGSPRNRGGEVGAEFEVFHEAGLFRLGVDSTYGFFYFRLNCRVLLESTREKLDPMLALGREGELRREIPSL